MSASSRIQPFPVFYSLLFYIGSQGLYRRECRLSFGAEWFLPARSSFVTFRSKLHFLRRRNYRLDRSFCCRDQESSPHTRCGRSFLVDVLFLIPSLTALIGKSPLQKIWTLYIHEIRNETFCHGSGFYELHITAEIAAPEVGAMIGLGWRRMEELNRSVVPFSGRSR